jgi:hypothetical protein
MNYLFVRNGSPRVSAVKIQSRVRRFHSTLLCCVYLQTDIDEVSSAGGLHMTSQSQNRRRCYFDRAFVREAMWESWVRVYRHIAAVRCSAVEHPTGNKFILVSVV